MSDDVFPGLKTGPNEHETRSGVEQQDAASLQRELNEQERIGNAQSSPFDHNRVPTPGSGDSAGGRVRRTSWPK